MTSAPPGLPESLGLNSQLLDLDPTETQEWLESLDQVVDHAGRNRARYLMLSVTDFPGDDAASIVVRALQQLADYGELDDAIPHLARATLQSSGLPRRVSTTSG